MNDYTHDPIRQAERAAAANITVYPIGFRSANRSVLREIAQKTGGEASFVDSAEDLPQVFSRVAENTTQVKDSDGDGLPDAVETEGFRDGRGIDVNG